MDNAFRPCLGSVRSNHLRFRRSDRPLPHGIRCVQLHGPSAAGPGREAAAENSFGSRHRRPGSIAQAAASLRESAGAAGSRSWTVSSRAGLGGARRRWAGRHRLYQRPGKRLLAIAEKGAMNLRTIGGCERLASRGLVGRVLAGACVRSSPYERSGRTRRRPCAASSKSGNAYDASGPPTHRGQRT